MKKIICAAVAAVCSASAFAFGGCSVGEATVNYKLSEDGTYYVVSEVTGDKRGLTTYEIPATYSPEEGGEEKPVKEIGEGAFMSCTSLKSIKIPESVTVIGSNAFTFCGLTDVIIPECVTSIGYGAFGGCTYLTQVTVPESVTTIEPMAFARCSSLKKAVVKANITVLDNQVFYNPVASFGGQLHASTSLKEVYLPASLQKICITALSGNVISDVYFAGTQEQWDKLYFYEMVEKEDDKEELEEKVYETSEVLPSTITIHFNVEF